MEMIRLFMGILLLICLILNVDFKKLHNIYEEQKILNETIEASSPLGIYVKDFKGRVKIVEVLDYTPAYNAGLEPGDRILKVNGCSIKNVKISVINGKTPNFLLNTIFGTCEQQALYGLMQNRPIRLLPLPFSLPEQPAHEQSPKQVPT